MLDELENNIYRGIVIVIRILTRKYHCHSVCMWYFKW